jgi:putative phosphonate catabolism associated alcohol dehydrogenase
VFHQAGQPLALEALELPEPADGEALVRLQLCTICGSDLHTVTGARIEPTPSILGHEALGIVERVGPKPPRDVEGNLLREGDRVTWSVCVSCQLCDRCQSGLPQKCRRLFKYGHGRASGRAALSGGLAEYLLLRPGSAIARVDAALPDVVACPVNCATSTIAAAFRAAGNVAGQRVALLGAGMLGVTAAAYAKSQGASRVVVIDPDPRRLERATAFGADQPLPWESAESLSELKGTFDVVIEASGATSAAEAACELADIGARIVLVGAVMPTPNAAWSPSQVVRRCLSIHGIHNYAPQDLRAALAFLTRQQHRYPFASLVEASFGLDQANRAVSYALEKRPIRVAVAP